MVIPTPSRRRARSSTYASGSTSSTSISKRRQNADSSGVGGGSTAHERYATGRSPQTRSITSRRFQSTISYPMKRKWLRRRRAASATGTDDATSERPR